MPAIPRWIARMSKARTTKADNPLLDLGCNLVLPILILNKGDDWLGLAPEAAILIALAFPVGWFIRDYITTRLINGVSILGVVSVLMTGGIGLLKLSPMAFAIKETAIPLALGLAVAFSAAIGKPFFREIIFGPKNRLQLDVDGINSALDSDDKRSAFDRLLTVCTWLFAASFLVSAILNFAITRMVVTTDPNIDAAAFNAEIGKQTGITFVVVSIGTLPVMLLAMAKLIKGFRRITGCEFEAFIQNSKPAKT